jgi:hypothetical protein
MLSIVSSTSFSESSSRVFAWALIDAGRFDLHDVQADVQRRQFLPHEIVQFVGKVAPLGLLHLHQSPRRLGRFQFLVLLLDEPRLRFSRFRRIHPDVEQHRDQQQIRDVEHTIDEERLAQQERAWRNLEGIHGERGDSEQRRQGPEQPGAACRCGKHQRKTEDRCDVDLNPRDEIGNDKAHRNEHGSDAQRTITARMAPGGSRIDRGSSI